MNRKSIENLVNELITDTAVAHGHDLTGRKGIDPIVQLINGKVFESLNLNRKTIVNGTNPPVAKAPAVAKPAVTAPKPVPVTDDADAA